MLATLRYHRPPQASREVRARVEARLHAFRGLVESATVGELLDALLGRATAARALIGSRPQLDHFGLLVPPGAEAEFRAAAAAAGFDRPSPSFPSRLVALELGMLAGSARIPTVVAKQTGTIDGHGAVAIEAFVPRADAVLARGWVERDVACHLAIDVAHAPDFERAVARFPALGLPMPPFVDGPRHVPAERATIAYFELGPGAPLPRLEVRLRDGTPA